MNDDSLDEQVARARQGNAEALQDVVRAVQDDVFALAIRMLGHREDALDATQEVLIRVVTKLGMFQGRSRFRTWVYRVAANALLNHRGKLRMREQTFTEAAAQLDAGLEFGEHHVAPEDPQHDALVNEVKQVCTQGMLMCLERPQRLAYALGEILELDSEMGAAILQIAPAAFRKRLSRARQAMDEFLHARCGLANPACRCRCARLVPAALASGIVTRDQPGMQDIPVRRADRLRTDIEELRDAAGVFRSLPVHASPADFAAAVRKWLDGNPADLGPI